MLTSKNPGHWRTSASGRLPAFNQGRRRETVAGVTGGEVDLSTIYKRASKGKVTRVNHISPAQDRPDARHHRFVEKPKVTGKNARKRAMRASEHEVALAAAFALLAASE